MSRADAVLTTRPGLPAYHGHSLNQTTRRTCHVYPRSGQDISDPVSRIA